MNDHITDPNLERGGSSWDALSAMTALVHHVPGMTVGHGVLSNTFRHPVILAKAATASRPRDRRAVRRRTRRGLARG